MTGGGPSQGRITALQAIGWAIAFLLVVVLVVLFFLYGRQVRPVLGVLPLGAWPNSLS